MPISNDEQLRAEIDREINTPIAETHFDLADDTCRCEGIGCPESEECLRHLCRTSGRVHADYLGDDWGGCAYKIEAE